MDTNTRDRENAIETPNVKSLSGCSDICKERADCQFWTWVDENGPADYALQCITMTNIPETISQPNIVSGGRDCGGRQLSSYSSLAFKKFHSDNSTHRAQSIIGPKILKLHFNFKLNFLEENPPSRKLFILAEYYGQ